MEYGGERRLTGRLQLIPLSFVLSANILLDKRSLLFSLRFAASATLLFVRTHTLTLQGIHSTTHGYEAMSQS